MRGTLTIALGGIIFPFFLNKVLGEKGFPGMVRYCALFVGILLASSCSLVTARLPKKPWNSKLNWIDLTLFKEPAFASYTVGAYLVMFVASISILRHVVAHADFSPGGDCGLLLITSHQWL